MGERRSSAKWMGRAGEEERSQYIRGNLVPASNWSRHKLSTVSDGWGVQPALNWLLTVRGGLLTVGGDTLVPAGESSRH